MNAQGLDAQGKEDQVEETEGRAASPLQHGVMPCDLTCKKCGSKDIYRQHRPKGKGWRVFGKEDYKNGYIKREFGWAEAKKEHIEHHCRECSFEWQSIPLGQKA